MRVELDPELESAYRHCRRLNAEHGKTFYLATTLLPPAKRPAIHALYGFARHADDLVDRPAPGLSPAAALQELRLELDEALAGGPAQHPTVLAVTDTVRRYGLDHRHLKAFLDSMASDLTVRRYPSFAELNEYMWGSASVIGLQLLPILGTEGGMADAEPYANDLGIAFQLTNFIRDVGEDYHRGRIYLPQESLQEHAVSEQTIESDVAAGRSSAPLKALIRAEVARARRFYARAEPGIALLSRDSRDCVRTAFTLYAEILDEVERADHDVLRRRATVSRAHRLRVGLGGYRAARNARRPIA
ncbi:MAG: crtB [Frankiales bacterium]|nr:crtB [Frankiales bacterium]